MNLAHIALPKCTLNSIYIKRYHLWEGKVLWCWKHCKLHVCKSTDYTIIKLNHSILSDNTLRHITISVLFWLIVHLFILSTPKPPAVPSQTPIWETLLYMNSVVMSSDWDYMNSKALRSSLRNSQTFTYTPSRSVHRRGRSPGLSLISFSPFTLIVMLYKAIIINLQTKI